MGVEVCAVFVAPYQRVELLNTKFEDIPAANRSAWYLMPFYDTAKRSKCREKNKVVVVE